MTAVKETPKEKVLEYLLSQNRPYSVNDITQNLHNKYSKSAIQKSLDELTAENKIREKVYGKQKVYSCIQRGEYDNHKNALELNAFDENIDETANKLKLIEKELKLVETELKTTLNFPTNQSAILEITELKETIGQLKCHLAKLSENNILKSSDENESVLQATHSELCKEYKKRKSLCMNIVHSILENYPKNLNSLLDDIGIEIDDKNMS